MKTLRFFGAVVATLAASGVLSVWAGGLDDLHAFVANFQSATGQFTQRVVSSSGKVSQSSGEFAFARPGKFRWTYEKPYLQVIVADGQKLTIFDQDLNQVTIRPLTNALGATPAAILFGEGNLEKSFILKDAGSHDGLDWLSATPKTHDTTFAQMSIGFRNGKLAGMELHDALGQTTELGFTDVVRNAAVSPKLFKFVVPEGADVLRN